MEVVFWGSFHAAIFINIYHSFEMYILFLTWYGPYYGTTYPLFSFFISLMPRKKNHSNDQLQYLCMNTYPDLKARSPVQQNNEW